MSIELILNKLPRAFRLLLAALFVAPAAYGIGTLCQGIYPTGLNWMLELGLETGFLAMLVYSRGKNWRLRRWLTAFTILGCALAYNAVGLALPRLNLSAWQLWLVAIMQGLPSPLICYIYATWLVEEKRPKPGRHLLLKLSANKEWLG